MIVSEIKIKHLKPEKLQNMFERIQKIKKSQAITFLTFHFLFAVSSNGQTNCMSGINFPSYTALLAADKSQTFLKKQDKVLRKKIQRTMYTTD